MSHTEVLGVSRASHKLDMKRPYHKYIGSIPHKDVMHVTTFLWEGIVLQTPMSAATMQPGVGTAVTGK